MFGALCTQMNSSAQTHNPAVTVIGNSTQALHLFKTTPTTGPMDGRNGGKILVPMPIVNYSLRESQQN